MTCIGMHVVKCCMPALQPKRPDKVTTTMRLDADLIQAMYALHARDGITMSEQIRRALRSWLHEKRVYPPIKQQHKHKRKRT